MDGEDVMVNLPYTDIRDSVCVWKSSLDGVKEASLVILGLGQPENVLIDRKSNEISGLLDFGRAFWGDQDMSQPQASSGIKGLL